VTRPSVPSTPPATQPTDVLLCTPRIAAEQGERLRSIAPEVELLELSGRLSPDDCARITIAFFSPDTYPDLAPSFMRVSLDAVNLRWFHTFSAGVDHPVFSMLAANGAVLTNSSGSTATPIAETVMMYLLALTRRLPDWFRAQVDHRWDRHRITELLGARVAVLGMGPIGLEIIRLTEAFGMEPIGIRQRIRGDETVETHTIDELPRILPTVDIVVIALPLTDQTKQLIDASMIEAMAPGTLLVNIGRGEIVDENALVDALRSGHLGGAGLDVFTTEPLPAESSLWDLPNVIVTPHSSGASDASNLRAIDVFCANLARWTAGEPLHHRVIPPS